MTIFPGQLTSEQEFNDGGSRLGISTKNKNTFFNVIPALWLQGNDDVRIRK